MATPMPVPPVQPGQQPSPQQIMEFQRQFQAEAARQGLTPQQFAQKIRAQQQAQQQQQQKQGGAGEQGQQQQQPQQHTHQHQAAGGEQVPIQPGPPTPEALAVANFLQAQDLKVRTCVFQEKRKDMFKGIPSFSLPPHFSTSPPPPARLSTHARTQKQLTNEPQKTPVKRAMRALHSPAYTKARAKNPLLPPVTDRATAENTFKLLPRSMLAIRVGRDSDSANPPHGAPGHVHGATDDDSGSKKKTKTKRGKDGKPLPWNVHIEQQQEADDSFHYVWFHTSTWQAWKQRLYALGALIGVVAVVLFPLWPLFLRQGVWYLSMACLGVLAAFFGLAIVRMIFFVVTVTAGPSPGVWIYPNLFEDVGFFDSFKPGWEWREVCFSSSSSFSVPRNASRDLGGT